jgi:hypothetical protein
MAVDDKDELDSSTNQIHKYILSSFPFLPLGTLRWLPGFIEPILTKRRISDETRRKIRQLEARSARTQVPLRINERDKLQEEVRERLRLDNPVGHDRRGPAQEKLERGDGVDRLKELFIRCVMACSWVFCSRSGV